jgi:hypothetical protein
MKKKGDAAPSPVLVCTACATGTYSELDLALLIL